MQTLNPSEISELIKTRIEKVKLTAEARNEGTVTIVSDGIVQIHGLADVMQGEMIELPNNTFALALNLERDSVGAVVLGDYKNVREGDVAKTTGRILEVPVGPELLGRVVNALGEPIDGKGPINAALTEPVEKVAPGVIASTALMPVWSGSCTGLRPVMPGAWISMRRDCTFDNAPLPSIGSPSALTTRPSSSGPVGTSRMRPVVLAESPSRRCS